ncbi:hypothetical protein OIU79_010520 [Salix purpurea]|uniref:Uncharacterized protein n=1 Tax=Salix purpurea TaxID=77065 RepID=A0A9Q0T9Q4_SALPP|nr:hypothetical protein OIU79_010520 [Salix purpurea]
MFIRRNLKGGQKQLREKQEPAAAAAAAAECFVLGSSCFRIETHWSNIQGVKNTEEEEDVYVHSVHQASGRGWARRRRRSAWKWYPKYKRSRQKPYFTGPSSSS